MSLESYPETSLASRSLKGNAMCENDAEAVFELNADHEHWIKNARRKYGRLATFWKELIQRQRGRCALTGALLLFDAENGTPREGARGCNPLYASVDHVNPGREDHGFQILCYDINDLKGHLPPRLFSALTRTEEWKDFARAWRSASEQPCCTREVLQGLIKNGGV